MTLFHFARTTNRNILLKPSLSYTPETRPQLADVRDDIKDSTAGKSFLIINLNNYDFKCPYFRGVIYSRKRIFVNHRFASNIISCRVQSSKRFSRQRREQYEHVAVMLCVYRNGFFLYQPHTYSDCNDKMIASII